MTKEKKGGDMKKKICFLVLGLLLLVCILGNAGVFFSEKKQLLRLSEEVVAIFVAFPDGEIILKRNIGSFRSLSPDDIALIPAKNEDISAKFVGFFRISSMGFGYDILTPVAEGEETL
ncbi:MAG: hypothetical protein UR69_C0001G0165 [Candidatus Moranbacteria bacterium GW2011_GWE2_35_2-]|nr:MAG: hypothetical protein UR69_C0001G0165 [Candidatus Moranbacteria bacterium GW2011_GWE2_35_2-]KKQ06251.1 MAG: hypothetical protein US15_C0015G0016 [Candidatus Moranbacteria bacterium GW2011_GWF1_36_4]KKQ22837.1 MAG: hypothetical protein US37_C0001G0109 [Candidatus Moranbacteria bacterium GW2011_GWF2_37_11]KKQ28651.1 MAG: hypothetical protein US44_C0008G0025 [Candidatus Moranbacteria bacterium GW2011_GWD1_37_17]KKQ30932.1 MAG: hypothetical protein US47_C0001G0165 [Candidatus Moranbacteria b